MNLNVYASQISTTGNKQEYVQYKVYKKFRQSNSGKNYNSNKGNNIWSITQTNMVKNK